MVRTDHAETAEWSVENAKCKMVKSPISAQLVHVNTVIGKKNYGRHKVCCDDDGATDAALVEEEI